MGWFSDIVNTVGDAVQQVVDTVDHAINVAADHPIETAALVVAAPYALEYATADSGLAAITSPVASGSVEASVLPALSSAPELTAAQTAQMIATEQASSAAASESFLPNLTTGQVLTGVNTGLNLATTGLKLATVANTGKLMNASTATANGLTGALGASPIQTPSGLITTTPQGAVVAGTSVPATTNGMMLDNQSMMVVAGAILGIFILSKYAKG